MNFIYAGIYALFSSVRDALASSVREPATVFWIFFLALYLRQAIWRAERELSELKSDLADLKAKIKMLDTGVDSVGRAISTLNVPRFDPDF